jgi:hypothetical protein
MIAQHRIILPNGGEVHISSVYRARDIFQNYEWVVSLMDPGKHPGFEAEKHYLFHVDDTEHPGPRDRLLTKGEVQFLTSLKEGPGPLSRRYFTIYSHG